MSVVSRLFRGLAGPRGRVSSMIVVIVVIAPFVAHAAFAQTSARKVTLKPGTIDPATRPVCPMTRPSPAATDEQRQRARDLAQRARESAVLGDASAALRSLENAAALDPMNSEISYELARAYETAIDPAKALAQYCRFLFLWPTASEAGDAVAKIKALAPWRPTGDSDSALKAFRFGFFAFQVNQFALADTAFTQAIAMDSLWADAYYNRAQVRRARDDRDGARADFQRYLALLPSAADRETVLAEMASLRRPTFSPASAFTLGLIVPGGGDFYTRRPALGALTAGGVGVALGFALLTSHESPIETTRPHLIPGLALAGGIALVSAVESAIYAQASNDAQARFAVAFVPGRNLAVAQIRLGR